eukprot:scaffold4818_cov164-Amphora_coffeaeformis.AAC.3
MPEKQPAFDSKFLDDLSNYDREHIMRLVRAEGIDPVRNTMAWWNAIAKYYNLWLNGKIVPKKDNRSDLEASTEKSTTNLHFHNHNPKYFDRSVECGGNIKNVNFTFDDDSWKKQTQLPEKNLADEYTKRSAFASSDSTGDSAKGTCDGDEPPLRSLDGRGGAVLDPNAIRRRRATSAGSLRVRFTVVNDEPSRNLQSYSYITFFRGIQYQIVKAKNAVKRGTLTQAQYQELERALAVSNFGRAQEYLGRVFLRFCEFLPERCDLISSLEGNPYAMTKPKVKKGKKIGPENTVKTKDPAKIVQEIEQTLIYIMKRVGHQFPSNRDDVSFLGPAMIILETFPETFTSM